MRKFDTEDFFGSIPIISVIVVLVYMFLLFLAMGCNASSISYKQREVRVFQKADSLNMKVAPAPEARGAGTRKQKGGGKTQKYIF